MESNTLVSKPHLCFFSETTCSSSRLSLHLQMGSPPSHREDVQVPSTDLVQKYLHCLSTCGCVTPVTAEQKNIWHLFTLVYFLVSFLQCVTEEAFLSKEHLRPYFTVPQLRPIRQVYSPIGPPTETIADISTGLTTILSSRGCIEN